MTAKDDWRGKPFCLIHHSACTHEDMKLGQAMPCFKCLGSGVNTITQELKEAPYNHNARVESVIKQIAYAKVKETYIFKTLYKTKTGEWTEIKDDGNWQQLNPKFPNKVCDVRYESYYVVNGEKIDDWKEARDRWIAFEYIKFMFTTKGGLSWLKP